MNTTVTSSRVEWSPATSVMRLDKKSPPLLLARLEMGEVH